MHVVNDDALLSTWQLEPVSLLEVTVPIEYQGDVMGDLNSRRGRVQGSETASLSESGNQGKQTFSRSVTGAGGYSRTDSGEGATLASGSGSYGYGQEESGKLALVYKNVDGYAGVNNHMGSRFTAFRPGMETVLRQFKARGLMFLDSRTSAQSVGDQTAQELGVPSIARHASLVPPTILRSEVSRTPRIASSAITANSSGSSRESRRRPRKCARSWSSAEPAPPSVPRKRPIAYATTPRIRSSLCGK